MEPTLSELRSSLTSMQADLKYYEREIAKMRAELELLRQAQADKEVDQRRSATNFQNMVDPR